MTGATLLLTAACGTTQSGAATAEQAPQAAATSTAHEQPVVTESMQEATESRVTTPQAVTTEAPTTSERYSVIDELQSKDLYNCSSTAFAIKSEDPLKAGSLTFTVIRTPGERSEELATTADKTGLVMPDGSIVSVEQRSFGEEEYQPVPLTVAEAYEADDNKVTVPGLERADVSIAVALDQLNDGRHDFRITNTFAVHQDNAEREFIQDCGNVSLEKGGPEPEGEVPPEAIDHSAVITSFEAGGRPVN